MLRPIFFIIVAFTLVVASAPDARAAMCFQYMNSGGGISVAQADLPAPNKCVSLALYEVGTTPGLTLLGAGTGTLCTSTNSNFVIFHYTYEGCMPLGSNNYFESGTCRLELSRSLGLPTEFSVCRGTVISGKPGQVGKVGNFVYSDDLVIRACDSNDIKFQVPSGTVAECLIELKRQSFDQPSQSSDQPTPAEPKP